MILALPVNIYPFNEIGMKTHRLHCQDPWFSFIENGQKKVEGRKNLPKYRNWSAGDIIVFYLGTREFKAVIRAIRHYKNLEEYLLKEGIERVLPGIDSLKKAMAIYMQWSSQEEIEKNGFLAIEVTRMQP